MLPLALSFLGIGKSIVQAFAQWLSRRSLIQILGLILGLALVFDHLALLASHRHTAKVEAQLGKCDQAKKSLQAQLDAISTRKNEQKIITQDRIKTVIRTVHDADTRATIVEKAPPAPNCKTKPEVLNADV